MKKGKAYIIGAGPGDFELLTLKAKRIIENADCIVYDRLISEDILKLAKKDAELIYLGKGNTEGGLIQDEINQTLVNKCLEGKNVARVKGGDPFVFGRGGEEVEALFQNEIEFEIIPGITSSISVPAYAGIPVTHRGIARSFHIFTGHTMENGKWHNFENIAKLEGTLVFLMGVKNLDLIVSDLIKYGKDSKTPVAIIEKGATKNQRVTVGNLENILELVEKNKILPPAITIIGEVVNLRETFKWFETEKLAKKILVTRDKKQAVEMSENISKRGGIPVELPFIEIENLKIDFCEEKLLSNDYNGENPTNQIVYLKVLFDKESKKILGCQIANERNIEARLKAIKAIMEKGGDLKELVKYKVNPTDNEWNPDILNLLALTALGKDKEASTDVEAKDIETLSKNKEFLLDVREEYEYEAGHVKGAVNLPLREILSQKDSLPKDRDIYVYCRSAHRSADAVNFLKSLGFDKVHNVEGGFIDISFNEYHKDKGNLENSIVTNYNFD